MNTTAVFKIIKSVTAFSIVLLLLCCGGGGGSGGGAKQESVSRTIDYSVLYSTVDSITVNVAYEPNAEPYAGYSPDFPDLQYWSVLDMNLQALFHGRILEPKFFVPKDLSEMEKIQQSNQKSWNIDQIVELANKVWDISETQENAEFYVLFLNGYLNDGFTLRKDVTGESLGRTPVIAIFKGIIAESPLSLFDNSIFEQETLVHEIGHSMGLVNNGIPMISDHEDPEHRRHCTVHNCVMGWKYEWGQVSAFSEQFISTGSVMMFCDKCIADTSGYLTY